MVRMIPDVISSEIKSTAEKKLFDEFQNYQTDENILILHSLGVAEHSTNIFGEIDFVIICGDGILCVEVKGGIVERNNGMWTFTNRFGKRDSRQIGPFEQAQGNMQSLRRYMVRKLGKDHPVCRAQYATCVLMPDCQFDGDGLDIIPEVLFDRTSGTDLQEVIENSFEYWRADCEDHHGFRGGCLADEEILYVANLLRGDFRFVPSLRDVIKDTYQELLALTDEQYEILEALEDNPRLLISGLAGTGKSVLAVEECKRACRSGKRVLYLCYNRNMAFYARAQFEKEYLDIEATTLHKLMENVCGRKTDEFDASYFSLILPQRFLGDSVSVDEYDLIVIDEGQDLINAIYLQCIDKLLKDGIKKGTWTIYYDPNQNIYNRSSEMVSQVSRLQGMSASFNLTVNCRNTKEIASANTLLTNIPQVNRLKASGPKVEQIHYDDSDDEFTKLMMILDTLHAEGVRNSDIVVLSQYAVDNVKCVLHNRRLPASEGALKAEGKIWYARSDELRFSTIAAFKGLESKVIIFTDVDSFKESSKRLLNYVAISRAEAVLYILYDVKAENERQEMLLNGFVKLK